VFSANVFPAKCVVSPKNVPVPDRTVNGYGISRPGKERSWRKEHGVAMAVHPWIRLRFMVGLLGLVSHAAAAEIAWTPQLLRDPAMWNEGAKDRAAIGRKGLRLTVGAGHTCELVAQSGIRLPENTGIVRVRMGELGAGAKWFLRIRGDLRGTGHVYPRQHSPERQSIVYWRSDLAGVKEVSVNADDGRRDVYDAVTSRFLARDASGPTIFTLPADRAVVLVVTPAGKTAALDGNKLAIEGVTVDYSARSNHRSVERS
jgi:hypothetical protein